MEDVLFVYDILCVRHPLPVSTYKFVSSVPKKKIHLNGLKKSSSVHHRTKKMCETSLSVLFINIFDTKQLWHEIKKIRLGVTHGLLVVAWFP
jgi:hypothetical protein